MRRGVILHNPRVEPQGLRGKAEQGFRNFPNRRRKYFIRLQKSDFMGGFAITSLKHNIKPNMQI